MSLRGAGLSKLKSLDVFSARVSDVGLGYLTALTSLTGQTSLLTHATEGQAGWC